MLDKAREIAGVFFYERQLSLLRESYLEQATTGNAPDDSFMVEGEKKALLALKDKYYNEKVRKAVKPDEAETLNDDEDFGNRSQTLAEKAIIQTHRQVHKIPYHGHPDYMES